MASDTYIIRGGAEGRARLRVLTEAMAPYTNDFLDKAKIPSGARVLDAGCGGGDVTREIARRVGPKGRALGTDIDEAVIAIAREDSQGIGNIAFETADILSGGIEGGFDAVYARFLLSHLSDPTQALRRMLALLRPGGLLLVEDVDFAGHFCHPPRAAFDDYVRWYMQAALKRGADSCLGLKLPALMRVAGAVGIVAHAVNPAACEGPIKQMAAITLAAIAGNLVSQGIAGQDAIGAALADLEKAATDNDVFMSMPRVVQVRAQRGG